MENSNKQLLVEMMHLIINDDYNYVIRGIIGCTNIFIQLLSQTEFNDEVLNELFDKLEIKNEKKYKYDDIREFYDNCVKMNLKGSKLWIAYKYYDRDCNKLMEKIKEGNDEEMIKKVNEEVALGWCDCAKDDFAKTYK